jgi:hypothetical protein
MRPSRLILVLPFVFLLTGCGDDKATNPAPPSDGLPSGTPKADSPAHLMERFEKTWEFESEAQYALLLSDDFRFHFSPASDPDLVNQYGENWRKTNEVAAIMNLFHGFVNGMGEQVPGAIRFDMSLTGVQYLGNDPDHPDSTAQYQKVIVSNLDMLFEVPLSPEPIQYHVSSRQEYFLVRGDAAVLASEVSADTTHWYLRKWDDLTVYSAARKGPVINPALPNSLGKIRSLYATPPPAAVRL